MGRKKSKINWSLLVWQVFTKICAKEAKCNGCGDLICTSGNMINLFKVFGLYLKVN